jgi:hypothetical protein
VIFSALAFVSGNSVQAQPATSAAPAAQAPNVTELNRSIDEVLKRPEFSWRLPRRATQPDPNQKNWLLKTLSSWLDKIGQWMDEFFDWLNKRARTNHGSFSAQHRAPALRAWYYGLIAFVIGVCILLLIVYRRRRPRGETTAELVTIATPDLASEETSADQLPTDEWLRTARECAGRNDFRLAVRALYLATLAQLGAAALIAIGRGKTNNEYARELRRRARSKPEIASAFTDTAGIFERAWYGMYDVDAAVMAQVEANLTTMRSRVEQ